MGDDILTKLKPKPIGEGDLIELWKYFRERGDADKQNMIATTTWLLGFALALLAYIVKNYTLNLSTIGDSKDVFIFIVTGMVVCGYAFYLVCQFGKHTRIQWLRAESFLNLICRLEEVLNDNPGGRYDPTKGIAPIYLRYRLIVRIVSILYLVVGCVHLIKLLPPYL